MFLQQRILPCRQGAMGLLTEAMQALPGALEVLYNPESWRFAPGGLEAHSGAVEAPLIQRSL
jgi:hypothetical protein